MMFCMFWKWFFHSMLGINVEVHSNVVLCWGKKKSIAVLWNYLKLWKRRFHVQFEMDGNCRIFMICYMFHEICISLVIHKTGMTVQVNTVWLILPKDQHKEHKNTTKHSSCRLHNGSEKQMFCREHLIYWQCKKGCILKKIRTINWIICWSCAGLAPPVLQQLLKKWSGTSRRNIQSPSLRLNSIRLPPWSSTGLDYPDLAQPNTINCS